ncbi:MAG TPA: thioredoxin family protein [Opitutaceae bacterium]|nr:thioredoxin family protein [Opitutaceae bacterium]
MTFSSSLFRIVTVVIGCLLAGLGSPDVAAQPVRNGSVQVELVSPVASVQPGTSFWVAVRLDHDPHWHTYWLNAGTGYPTSIAWTLPEGYKAGPIVWPAPHAVKDRAGTVTGNGYEDRAYLFTEISVPPSAKPGETVAMTAAVEWLMCETVCMPGDAKLTLRLPVKAEAPAANTAVAAEFERAFKALPRPSSAWKAEATRTAGKVTLTLKPASSGGHVPTDLHFFDDVGLVDYAAPQAVRADGNGGFVLEMTVGADPMNELTELKGVVTSKNGWESTAGGPAGLIIAARLSSSNASATGDASTGKSPVATTPQPPPSGGTPSGDSAGAGAAAGGSTGLMGTLLLAFLGGLVLNLMPCVFPVLGIKVLGFVKQSGHQRAKVVQHGLVFALGVLLSFWALAAVLLILRAGGEQLGWGFQLQSPAFVFGMAVFMLIFALNLSGLFEVGLSATGAGAGLQSKDGLAGSFFTGMLATVVATPCSAPFLAPALGAALALSPVESFAVFTAIAVGLGAPYLLLSLFPQAVKVLPRPGAWMETFKQFMAFPLYATVAWLLWVLAAQTSGDENALLMIAFGFVIIAMAAWAYGRFGQTYGKPVRRTLGTVAAAGLLVWGLWLGWPKTLQAGPVAGASAGEYQVVWQKWSPEAVAAAQASGKYAYVDFTARWCATCQTNKATVFSSKDVLDEFGRKDVVLFKADWTNKDPQITQELAKWNRSAVPFNLIYAPKAAEPVVLPELLTGGKVLEALRKAESGAKVAKS